MSTYEKLSEERKKLQESGSIPDWWTTGGWQIFKEKYLYGVTSAKEQYNRIAKTLAAHTPDPEKWADIFINLMLEGILSSSSPILSNTGTTRGLPVSCSGQVIGDSIYSIYESKLETAMLTKMGFGTAAYLGNIRPRGSNISTGGTSMGVLPIIEGFQKDMEYVAQGATRRGSWAGYLPIEHGDFDEVCTYLETHPDGNNIGWCVSEAFIDRLKQKEPEAIRRYKRVLKVKTIFGKGYFFFPDKANAKRPKCYVDKGLEIKSPQLCNEIMLHSSEEETYSCVLASLNLVHWDKIKGTDVIFNATVFLDCVCQEFLERAKNIKGLEKVVSATKKGRALGLGVCGYHSYLQKNMIPFESLEAYLWNVEVFSEMRREADRASEWLASVYGEPEWLKGYGRANTHTLAVAPTKSTALIMGGVSEGINPDVAMVYTQRSAGGEILRVNPYLLDLMKKKGVYNKKNVQQVRDAMGSVQGVSWLTDEEKAVFKTAFEINQFTILNKAAARGKYIDQWQSLNLFFAGSGNEKYINDVHREAFLNPDILGLYYIYGQAGVQASKDECVACQ